MPSEPVTSPTPDQRSAKAQRYGRYILLDRIGTGGMAEVFRALVLGPQRFQRIIVVKRILPEISKDPRFVQMFINEANICARLSHPNIVQIYEFGEISGTHFIAMEHVHGRNLRAILARVTRAGRALPPAVAADVARQVCVGLDYAHTLSSADGQPLHIIHRDISPTNIMISFTGGVKVLDFGIARAAGELAGDTSTGVKGKLSYVAPELIQFGEVDQRADIFSLGVVLHECITGHRLFKAEHDAVRARLVVQMPIPRPSSRNPAVPPALDRIVMRSLERNPARRYGSAAEMARDLERFLLDTRHSAQDTVTLLREFFADEMTPANELGIPKAELEILMAQNAPAAGLGTAAGGTGFEGLERTGTSTNTLLSASDASLGTPLPAPPGAPAAPVRRHRGTTRRNALIAAAALAMLSTGMATGLWLAGFSARHSSKVRISFDSSPQEARVYFQSSPKLLGTTPCAVELPRGTDRVVFQIELDGHLPATLKLLPDFDKPIFVDLRPKTAAASAAPTAPPAAAQLPPEPTSGRPGAR